MSVPACHCLRYFRDKHGLIVTSIFAGILVLAAGCSKPAAPPPGKPVVEVSEPISRDVTDYEDFTGHIDAVATVEIRARVTGNLDKVYFTEGKVVKAGDPLVLIDPRPYKIAVDACEAAVQQADVNLATLKDVRDRSLGAVSGVSEQDRTKSVNDYNAGLATLNAAKASLANARLNLLYTAITTPITGKVGKRMIDPGNMVQANTTALTTIRSIDPIYGYFDVDERTVLRLRRAAGTLGIALATGPLASRLRALQRKEVTVEYALADDDGYSKDRVGTLNFEDNQIDISTGTQRFRCLIENANHLLLPGMFVRVRFILGEPYQAVLISERAIGTDQGQKYVYVVKKETNPKTGEIEDRIEYRRIKVGQLDNGMRVILDGTLKPQERIVVVGLQRVRPNIAVEAKEIPMPTGSTLHKPALTTNVDKK